MDSAFAISSRTTSLMALQDGDGTSGKVASVGGLLRGVFIVY